MINFPIEKLKNKTKKKNKIKRKNSSRKPNINSTRKIIIFYVNNRFYLNFKFNFTMARW